MHTLSHSEVARVFNRTFPDRGVVMSGGYAEPLYVPGINSAQMRYTRDHTESALHEAAHWRITGRPRRRLTDYGYLYSPPLGTGMDRARFEVAEVEAQSMELLFAEAAGSQFRARADDINVFLFLLEAFRYRILERAHERRRTGLSSHADKFRAALYFERHRIRTSLLRG